MKSELVQGPIKFPIDIDLEKMIITSPNMNLEIKIYHEDEQGFYVDYQNQVYRLEYNPISKNYWFMYLNKTPFIRGCWFVRANICHKLKFISFIISKNGCSSILKTSMVHDGTYDTIQDHSFIWNNPQYCFEKNVIQNIAKCHAYPDYIKFVVLEDSFKRFLRWLNWSWKNKYNKYYNFNLSKEDFIKEHLWSLPYITRELVCCDEHVIQQEKYFEHIRKEGFEPLVVQLSDLPIFFKNQFGVELIKNNISSPSERIFTKEDFTEDQLKEIYKFLNIK